MMIIIIIICLHYISIVYLVKCEARRFHNNIQKDLCPPRRTLLFSTEHPRQSFCDLCTLAPRTTDNRPTTLFPRMQNYSILPSFVQTLLVVVVGGRWNAEISTGQLYPRDPCHTLPFEV